MPFEIHTPPWTNFHDLNLDWMIQTIKSLETRVSALENGDTPEPGPTPVYDATIGSWASYGGGSHTYTFSSGERQTFVVMLAGLVMPDNEAIELIGGGYQGFRILQNGLYAVSVRINVDSSTTTNNVSFNVADTDKNVLSHYGISAPAGYDTSYTFFLTLRSGDEILPMLVHQDSGNIVLNDANFSVTKLASLVYPEPI